MTVNYSKYYPAFKRLPFIVAIVEAFLEFASWVSALIWLFAIEGWVPLIFVAIFGIPVIILTFIFTYFGLAIILSPIVMCVDGVINIEKKKVSNVIINTEENISKAEEKQEIVEKENAVPKIKTEAEPWQRTNYSSKTTSKAADNNAQTTKPIEVPPEIVLTKWKCEDCGRMNPPNTSFCYSCMCPKPKLEEAKNKSKKK